MARPRHPNPTAAARRMRRLRLREAAWQEHNLLNAILRRCVIGAVRWKTRKGPRLATASELGFDLL